MKWVLMCLELDCIELNIYWTLENPRSSRIFFTPALQRLCARRNITRVDFDMCMFGLCDPVSTKYYQKPTSLIGTLPNLSALGCKCTHSHEHETVEGSVQIDGKAVKRSFLAGRYPNAFCAQLAHLVNTALVQARGSRLQRRNLH